MFRTVEFWVAIATNVCGILVISGVITPDQSSELVVSVQSIIGGLLSILSTFKLINTQIVRRKLAVGAIMDSARTKASGAVRIESVDADLRAALDNI